MPTKKKKTKRKPKGRGAQKRRAKTYKQSVAARQKAEEMARIVNRYQTLLTLRNQIAKATTDVMKMAVGGEFWAATLLASKYSYGGEAVPDSLLGFYTKPQSPVSSDADILDGLRKLATKGGALAPYLTKDQVGKIRKEVGAGVYDSVLKSMKYLTKATDAA